MTGYLKKLTCNVAFAAAVSAIAVAIALACSLACAPAQAYAAGYPYGESYGSSIPWDIYDQLDVLDNRNKPSAEVQPAKEFAPEVEAGEFPLVYDEAGILTQQQVDALQAKAEAISEKNKCNVYIITVDDMKDYSTSRSMASFAEGVMVDKQLGYGDGRDSVALVMSMAGRDYDVVSYGPVGLNKVYDAEAREWIADKFLPAFKGNNWSEGFSSYLDAADEAFGKRMQGIPLDRPAGIAHIVVSVFVCLLIGFIIAIIVSMIIRGSSKSVSSGTEAHAYTVPEGTQITFRNDAYTHTTQSRVYSPKSESKSGGGGSFTSSGGFGHTTGKF